MRRTPLLLILAALLALAAPAGAEDLTQTLAVERPGRLRVELDRGSVEVQTHPAQSVYVEATARGLGANGVAFEVVREGDDVVLRARTEEWIDWLSSGPRLSVLVFIPPFFEVVNASDHVLITRRDAVELSYPTRAVGNRTQ
ncbi:MAG TPA: hypothetical protein VII72_16885 [Myxococcota bacterium]|jgi:hypothetical protein